MKITRTSTWSGKERTLDLPITQDQFNLWRNGLVIQKAMPQLSDNDREFIISGMTPEEWDEMCKEDEDEEAEEATNTS